MACNASSILLAVPIKVNHCLSISRVEVLCVQEEYFDLDKLLATSFLLVF